MEIDVPGKRSDPDRPAVRAIASILPSCLTNVARRRELPADRLFRDDAKIVHLNRVVGTLTGAETTTDTPIADLDLAVGSALDRSDRTTDHARWIQTLAASRRHEKAIKSRPVEEQSRVAVVVCIDASPHTIAASSTTIEVDQQQVLALNKSFVAKLFRSH